MKLYVTINLWNCNIKWTDPRLDVSSAHEIQMAFIRWLQDDWYQHWRKMEWICSSTPKPDRVVDINGNKTSCPGEVE